MIQIAGETLTEQDWPEGSPYFEFNMGLDNQWRFLFPDHLNIAPNPYAESISEMEWKSLPVKIEDCQPWEIHLVAAVARCHFLDKAKELFGPDDERIVMPGGVICPRFQDVSKYEKYRRYLASAEKWARIGRAK